MSVHELSVLLWGERRLLELLLLRLEQVGHVVADGRVEWVGHAVREVEGVVDRLRVVEVARAAAADLAAEQLGLAPETPLAVLAERSLAPWDRLLAEHLDVLTRLTAEVRAEARGVGDQLRAAHAATREALGLADPEPRRPRGTGAAEAAS